ncbi:MAG: TetR/AcrR family transcriptional regulator [Gemmatimonadetes bacterium]|nr:TetR/AcrR family transcriptional regulator [Gemmatimonadota bacterium]
MVRSSLNTDTATRLRTTGRRIFARQGYEGASLRAITREARANLGAVTYHFGSKEGLYEAVVDSALAPLRNRVTEAASVPGTPLQRIEGVVRAFFAHLNENPDMPNFLLQQVTSGVEPITPVLQTMQHGIGTLSTLLREGQKDGTILESDMLPTVIGIIALPVHLTLVGQLLSRASGFPGSVSAGQAEEHAIQFVGRALIAKEAS